MKGERRHIDRGVLRVAHRKTVDEHGSVRGTESASSHSRRSTEPTQRAHPYGRQRVEHVDHVTRGHPPKRLTVLRKTGDAHTLLLIAGSLYFHFRKGAQ